jgi:hypothetical protein
MNAYSERREEMASLDVGIHPDATQIEAKHFPGGPPASFSILEFGTREGRVSVFVNNLTVLDAIQDAIDAIRAALPARSGKENAA